MNKKLSLARARSCPEYQQCLRRQARLRRWVWLSRHFRNKHRKVERQARHLLAKETRYWLSLSDLPAGHE